MQGTRVWKKPIYLKAKYKKLTLWEQDNQKDLHKIDNNGPRSPMSERGES